MTLRTASSPWEDGALPENVVVGADTRIVGDHAFRRFKTTAQPGLVIGARCLMDGVHFAVGSHGRVTIGDSCYFTNAILLCELELRIGSFVVIGWNATLADTDFHPLEPAERIADARACSPLGGGLSRPDIPKKGVVIEDDVWIGPNATILKGVTIGSGSWIEPGALVTHDVPPRSRVLGNPAQVVGQVTS